MISIISPAKSVNFDEAAPVKAFTLPDHLTKTRKLARALKRYDSDGLQELMSVSQAIANLNVDRFKTFKTPFTPENAKQALYAFRGDVYRHMRMNTYGQAELDFAQDHLRILSGFYGVLRPLDLIQPYRLEMKTPLALDETRDLYAFWGDDLTRSLNKSLKASKSQALINLASKEYARAVQFRTIKAPVITIDFKEVENGKAKVIAIFAKWARGMMADYIIQHQLEDPEALKSFNESEYAFSRGDSTDKNWVFTRPRPE